MDSSASQQRVSEHEALIESSFRRLIASIESEREKIRSTWTQIDEEEIATQDDLARLKLDTEEWCNAERTKVENEWKRLDRLRERMSVLWPGDKEVLEINCSGTIYELPKRLLCNIEGSYLNHMFSAAYLQSVPRDDQDRYFLDFNPTCFGIIVGWLIDSEHKRDLPPPPVPESEQMNMDILAEALNLKPFMRHNTIMQHHGTSLMVAGNTVEATHMGWCVVAAEQPLSMAGNTYFEIKILNNPDPTTDRMAFGICAHVPKGTEAHQIRIKDSVLYNSNVGLIGPAVETTTIEQKLSFTSGSTFGIRHDVKNRTLHFWYNKLSIGSCTLNQDALERMSVMYPIFAMHVAGQKIEVDFSLSGPTGSRKGDVEKTAQVGPGTEITMAGGGY
mmetsp:Transcript_53349/g.95753  ORF Transcript_53349/g.95753 Transcript_53349/m.95753 type:complete len:389 (+) Transcript_53349:57-1223(+)|eukprot:CAMPEP_0197620984 /NCGR_PEP_ID=MMETSP1338-20131121/1655_1 /TAXON_ID=43686 ORGANISM="Pelagodinium beii, Strain RCC1491" /NCGR_SAMPLE_ID=MMETSP1338 /ASSEMBLY_ACC=CAM_ASM_000754 /LENGTH=388 /DNA_ID=CAMNT_0043190301 /DNA_START=53 /DNA_END=1219 /DNA_ORIENTATION=+